MGALLMLLAFLMLPGLAFSFYYGSQDEVDVMGGGLYLQGEYIIGLKSWFSVRPYAGAIFESVDKNQNLQNQPQYKVTTNAFLVGGKIRICAPIPWVAPFIESGIGASIGKFETFTPSVNFNKSDALLHIPFNFGLAVGRHNSLEIGFSGYLAVLLPVINDQRPNTCLLSESR